MNSKDTFDKIDILLVDDRSENLLALESVLSCPDYNLTKTRSGDEALRYLLDHTPALILMDVQMPYLNGFETASIIKGSERTREIPIIFITAINKDEQFIHQGYVHGAVDYIYKPYDADILKAKVAIFADIRRQHNRIARLVSVQQAATQALAESTDVRASVSKILKSICTSLRWDLGIFWRVDKQSNALGCYSEWHDPAYDASAIIAESFKRRFPLGVDVPGKVLAENNALWFTDVLEETDSPHLAIAAKDNLHTAVVLSVFVQDEAMGILEFYSRQILPHDPDLVKILSAIASQVGQVLIRIEALDLSHLSEARAQAAIRVRDEFLSIASHELKTPITALKMMIQAMQRNSKLEEGRGPSPERLSKMLNTSIQQVDRLTHLVEDLLDVVKIRAGKLRIYPEEIDLSDLVKKVVERYTDVLAAAKCAVELKVKARVIGIWDSARIEQIVVNLISNVIKYAPGKPIRIEVSDEGETGKFTVQDFGPGIPYGLQTKVFERFERAISSHTVSGLGLGLYIVKQIVEAHDGTIRVDSEHGRGSIFIVELPKKRLDAAPKNEAEEYRRDKSNLFCPGQEPQP